MLVRADLRLPALRRARSWLCEAMSSADLVGLMRIDAEKASHEVVGEIEKLDARAGRYTLFEGKWSVRYENMYTHEYLIKVDGSLAFDRCISPDGTPFTKSDEQSAKLVRRGGVILVRFANGRVMEQFSLKGDKLIVERFDPASLYPGRPNNKGVGVRQAPL
jgi:hypothetical protein